LNAKVALEPFWSVYDFKRFPAVLWATQNLTKLKERNKEKLNKFNSSFRVTRLNN
jgi:hypothetical protein